MSADDKGKRSSPLWVRMILKIPKLSLEDFSDSSRGLFWILGPPLFLVSDFFLDLLLVMYVPSPFNVILFVLVNTLIALLFLRILVERTLASEEAIYMESRFRWDIDRSFNEYLSSVEEQKKKNKARKD